MFIAVVFIIAKCRKQPKCPSVDEEIKNTVIYLHNGILHRKKEGIPTFCYRMVRTGEYYAK